MTVSCVFQCSWLVFLYLFHLHCSFADPCSDKVPRTNKTRIGIFELQWGATLLHISRSRYAALYEEWQTLFKFLRMGKRLGWSWDPSSAFRENESKKESKKEKIKKTSARSEDSPRKVSRKTLETEIMINLGHSVINLFFSCWDYIASFNLDNLFCSNHWVVHSCISKFHKAIWSRGTFKVL